MTRNRETAAAHKGDADAPGAPTEARATGVVAGFSAPMELTMTYRSTSAARAAWSTLIAPSRSMVSLRSAPLPGPAPAADRVGQIFRAGTLQVADDGLAAVPAEVVGVSWIANHAA